MYNIHARPSRDLRTHYADVIRDLEAHNQVLITNNGRGEAVLIGVEDYAEYEEFLHIRYVQEKLTEAEAAEKNPATKWLGRDKFFANARAKL